MLLSGESRGHRGTSKLRVTFAVEKQMRPCPGRGTLVHGGQSTVWREVLSLWSVASLDTDCSPSCLPTPAQWLCGTGASIAG